MTKEEKIIKAVKSGADSIQKISILTGIDYNFCVDWYAENKKEVERLSIKPVVEAEQIVYKESKKDVKTAQWLLTHHKEAKKEWSEKIEQKTELSGGISIQWNE